jgi:hypothetical protein
MEAIIGGASALASPARINAQRALYGFDGSVHAQVAILPRRPQQTARAARELGLLTASKVPGQLRAFGFLLMAL